MKLFPEHKLIPSFDNPWISQISRRRLKKYFYDMTTLVKLKIRLFLVPLISHHNRIEIYLFTL